MNLYLDIDGVLLTKAGEPANFVSEFLEHITRHHGCYWLSTHCRGDVAPVIEWLQRKLPAETMQHVRKIKPTNWGTLKTDAINFNHDFWWLDDYVMEAEKSMLKQNGCEDKFILMDLKSNPNQLIDVLQNLQPSP